MKAGISKVFAGKMGFDTCTRTGIHWQKNNYRNTNEDLSNTAIKTKMEFVYVDDGI